MNSRKTEIRKRLNLKDCLNELEILSGRKVEENELTSLQFMEEFRERVKAIPASPTVKFTIAFERLRSREFGLFVSRLHDQNMAPVYLWTPRTNDCGLFKLKSIADVNFSFSFDVNSEGILSIVTADAQDRLLLDFSEERAQKMLEIEIHGRNWVRVPPLV